MKRFNWVQQGDHFEATHSFRLLSHDRKPLQGRQAMDVAGLAAGTNGAWLVKMIASPSGPGTPAPYITGQAENLEAAKKAAIAALPGFLKSVRFPGNSMGSCSTSRPADRIPDTSDLE